MTEQLRISQPDPLEAIRSYLETQRHVNEARKKLILVILKNFFLEAEGLSLTPNQRVQIESGKFDEDLRMYLLDYVNRLIKESETDLPVPVDRQGRS